MANIMKYYSVLEKHKDGSWWYHGHTFPTWGEADAYRKQWIWWDKDRPKTVIGHDDPLPELTLSTGDLRDFRSVGGPTVCTIDTTQL